MHGYSEEFKLNFGKVLFKLEYNNEIKAIEMNISIEPKTILLERHFKELYRMLYNRYVHENDEGEYRMKFNKDILFKQFQNE